MLYGLSWERFISAREIDVRIKKWLPGEGLNRILIEWHNYCQRGADMRMCSDRHV